MLRFLEPLRAGVDSCFALAFVVLCAASPSPASGAEQQQLPGFEDFSAARAEIRAAVRGAIDRLRDPDFKRDIDEQRSRVNGIRDGQARPSSPFVDLSKSAHRASQCEQGQKRPTVLDDASNQASQSGYAGRLYAFVSLGMPDDELHAVVEQARRYDAQIVIRGLYGDDFRATLARLGELGIDRGIEIDPLLFRTFEVSVVPTYVLALQAPTEESSAPQHIKASGAVSVRYFLELVERSELAPAATRARRRLELGQIATRDDASRGGASGNAVERAKRSGKRTQTQGNPQHRTGAGGDRR